MGQVFEAIDPAMEQWIAAQRLFFVATAPLAGAGLVNCSPKGLDSLRVVDPHTLAYLDLTGSGVETIAHLRENARVVIMLCAFEGAPRIVRLHGRGEVLAPDHAEWAMWRGMFPPLDGVRAVIRVNVTRISDSCGYGVPLMRFEAEREALPRWVAARGAGGIEEYQRTRNARSLDGLTGVDWL